MPCPRPLSIAGGRPDQPTGLGEALPDPGTNGNLTKAWAAYHRGHYPSDPSHVPLQTPPMDSTRPGLEPPLNHCQTLNPHRHPHSQTLTRIPKHDEHNPCRQQTLRQGGTVRCVGRALHAWLGTPGRLDQSHHCQRCPRRCHNHKVRSPGRGSCPIDRNAAAAERQVQATMDSLAPLAVPQGPSPIGTCSACTGSPPLANGRWWTPLD
mmetsp:Transcript_4554/g.8178  ORF Transcript_4554/g.8178 Transcript_4554/m.8178 type:complete len:208 (-) Transcript_4554:655-1278(-)